MKPTTEEDYFAQTKHDKGGVQSPTPRTDAEAYRIGSFDHPNNPEVVPAKLARTLERELTEAVELLRQIKKYALNEQGAFHATVGKLLDCHDAMLAERNKKGDGK